MPFSRFEISHWADGLLPLAVLSPMALVVIYHCALPDRRGKMWSTLCAIALPLYLAIGREVFVWDMPNWVPAVALGGAIEQAGPLRRALLHGRLCAVIA